MALTDAGANVLLECGPGKVLTGLNRRSAKRADLTCLAIDDEATLAAALNLSAGVTHV
jgi:[acyl-carrier-protein] S-malonyltransferase